MMTRETTTTPKTTIFVYGTLKRGFPNFAEYLAGAEFIGDARTLEAFPLLIGGRWRSPYLIDAPGHGHTVLGEVFAVDGPTLARLDVLESIGKPGGYHARGIDVALGSGRRVDALAYLKAPGTVDPVHRTLTDHYPADAGYVPRHLR